LLQIALCENCQRQSCKAFIGLTNRAKIIGGERPLVPEILDQSDHVGAKSPIFDIFSLVTPLSVLRLSCKAFIGLTISVQKWLVGGDPWYLKFWVKVTALERNLNKRCD